MKKHGIKARLSPALRRLVGHKLTGRDVVLFAMPMYAKPNPTTIERAYQLISDFHGQGMGYDIDFITPTASALIAARNLVLERWSRHDYIGVLFLDDDMDFPVRTGFGIEGENLHGFNPLVRMISREKDILSGLTTTRKRPLRINCGMEVEDGTIQTLADEALAGPANSEPFRQDYVGFGMVYARSDALRKMADVHKTLHLFDHESLWDRSPDCDAMIDELVAESRKTWNDPANLRHLFRMKILALQRRSVQLYEDFSFCRKARAAGCEVWVDPSFDVRHIGDYGFGRQEWLAEKRFIDELVAEAASAVPVQEGA